MQNLSMMLLLFETVGNNQSRFVSLAPRGKKAMTPRRSRALDPSWRNVGEASKSPTAAVRLWLCIVSSTLVRHHSHSSPNRMTRSIKLGHQELCSEEG